MNLAAVMDQLGASLAVLPGLNVYPYTAKRIAAPAVVVGFPDPIDYQGTYRRGMDTFELVVWLMVGAVDTLASRDALGEYLDGSGARSVKTLIEAGTYTACHTVTVTKAQVEFVTVSGVDYLAAKFDVEITGSGA